MLIVVGHYPGPLQGAEFYIDYAAGDDHNPGTKARPWQHHPWDREADGQAKQIRGLHTYFFKKGVVYRGQLVAGESGRPDQPIVLTVDPGWGTGDAAIYGSDRIRTPWQKCTPGTCRQVENLEQQTVWYTDAATQATPRLVFELRGDGVLPLRIARAPNLKQNCFDDPRAGWWEGTGAAVDVRIVCDDAAGFDLGDAVYSGGNLPLKENNQQAGKNRIIAKGHDWLTVRVRDADDFTPVKGSLISNGRFSARIHAVAGSAQTTSRLQDTRNLIQPDPAYWDGATVWAESERQPFPFAARVEGFDPRNSEIFFHFNRPLKHSPRQYDRYMLENLLQLLDAPGEWIFQRSGQNPARLFVRLTDDRDPNHTMIEAACRHWFLKADNRQHIRIEGLTFSFFNSVAHDESATARNAGGYSSVILLRGQCRGITVSDCHFAYSSHGISAFPLQDHQVIADIHVNGNHFRHLEGYAVHLTTGRDLWIRSPRGHGVIRPQKSRLKRIRITDNLIVGCGFRELSNHRAAIGIHGGELVEVARNHIDTVYGPGILVYNGDFFDRAGLEFPLNRTLIHDNVVVNTLLAGQDHGGISSWLAGPAYIYNNVSDNPVGCMHARQKTATRRDWFRRGCFGAGIYLDQQYKGYVFNNLIRGETNDENTKIYNAVGLNEAQGFLNTVFNNTIQTFSVGLHKGMVEHNRCSYIGNRLADINNTFILHEPTPAAIEFETLAYAANQYAGDVKVFGQLGRQKLEKFEQWQNFLTDNQARASDNGSRHIALSEIANANANSNQTLAKVFVPWGLYRTAGEWGFYLHPHQPARITGEHVNWNAAWKNRLAVDTGALRNDLTGFNIKNDDFTPGILEDWTRGALRFDGQSQYCQAEKSRELDLGNGNFIIEVVTRLPQSGRLQALISKRDANAGYSLVITPQGTARFVLHHNGGVLASYESDQAIDDNQWHHLLVEIERNRHHPIRIFIDGRICNGTFQGIRLNQVSFSNQGPFIVGRSSTADSYFKGELDFLRISLGSLSDAATDIQALYDWQFDGPFLKRPQQNSLADLKLTTAPPDSCQ